MRDFLDRHFIPLVVAHTGAVCTLLGGSMLPLLLR
jgi:hypothetical protein